MKILLIAPYGIGNVILALPAMKQLRDHFPEARIDCLTTLRSVYHVVTGVPDFRLFQNIYQLTVRDMLTIIRQRYDYSLLLFPSPKIHYNLLNFFTLAKKRIGSRFPGSGIMQGTFLNTHSVLVKPGLHDVYQNLELLSVWGIKGRRVSRLVSLLADRNKRKTVGVHPGCKIKDHYKKWDNGKYAGIIRLILDRTSYRIKLFFGPDEMEHYQYFYEIFKENKRISYVHHQSIRSVFNEINECRFFLSNDTGLMHIANFLGVYNIVLAGPSDWRRTGLFNRPYQLIRMDLNCIPCSHTYHLSSYRFRCIYGDIRCMKEISVKKVWKILEMVL
ncbi:MAG: glycosyltransferase family 9 protein [bacterium]|nr:glycosyltransferase family 9 protein [bacterium]